MSYRFRERLNYLGQRKKNLNFVTGDYDTGTVILRGIKFTPEMTRVIDVDAAGFLLTKMKIQDFIVDTDDLKINHVLVQPATGHTVTITDDQDGKLQDCVFELCHDPLVGDEQVFKYTTTSRNRIRFHTKQVTKGDT